MTAYFYGPEIQLTTMPQLELAIDKEDDWTGLTDAAARRKRQNRLNVRAYRLRKSRQAQAVAPLSATGFANQLQKAWWNEDRQMVVSDVPMWFANSFSNNIQPLLPAHVLVPGQRDATHSLATGIVFPPSSDHLITLIQYNVLRASTANLKLLNLIKASNTTAESGVAVIEIVTELAPCSPNGEPLIPPLLQPTLIQRTIKHNRWIDIIPHPVWRDNLILAQNEYDSDEICNDTVGGLWDDKPSPGIEERGVIAWSPPWDISGWEISPGFLRKWGWLFKGCEEVLEATNQWRRMRGEEDLILEL